MEPVIFKNVDLNNPKSVLSKVLKDAIRNIIFYGIAALVIAYIINGLNWRTFGFILAIPYSLILAIGVVKFVLVDVLLQIISIVGNVVYIFQRKPVKINKEFPAFLGVIILLIENSASCVFILYLYNAYYNVDLLGIF
ncbi:hypothetical protein [Paenibacillus sp. FSL R5-0912]|uniref:hypothetical protein n=1 Tax=Paenibacillus sp. FSL R5-0912 TaxID=1536771 RepID=UPI0004F6B9B9|nr:hypothetical protein [Paenibacillus sp. FSL R5-0912]AIQ41086.1 hypothetical protein R50912_14440 [Paenibacillus sp. FSL R5-0912]